MLALVYTQRRPGQIRRGPMRLLIGVNYRARGSATYAPRMRCRLPAAEAIGLRIADSNPQTFGFADRSVD